MKTFKLYLFSLKRNIFAIIFVLFIFCLLIFSSSNITATKTGLNLWVNSVVPSLFPFLVATELLSYTNAVNFIGRKLNKLMKPVFNMPGVAAYPLILGFISGYPIGAKMVCKLYGENLCSKKEAEVLLAYTNNSGPLFIVGTVGISMFGSSIVGLILLVSHIISALLVGIIFGKIFLHGSSNYNNRLNYSNSKNISLSSLGEVLSNSIFSSVKTLFMVGGYVVIFSVIISILNQTGLITLVSKLLLPIFQNNSFAKGVVTGLLELTNGLNAISNIHIKAISLNIITSSFLLGFAGISIMLQIISVISKSKLSIKPYILGKILQAVLSVVFTFLILKLPIFNFDLI